MRDMRKSISNFAKNQTKKNQYKKLCGRATNKRNS